MADFLTEKRREIKGRLDELKPLVDEYNQLDAALRALEGVGGDTPAPARARRRSPTSTSDGAGKSRGRRGRPRGSGTRGKQALELVRSKPGITIPELAQEMGIQQNYLYRVLPGLQKDGMVRKEGRGWHPLETA
jgi:hypothetical protein